MGFFVLKFFGSGSGGQANLLFAFAWRQRDKQGTCMFCLSRILGDRVGKVGVFLGGLVGFYSIGSWAMARFYSVSHGVSQYLLRDDVVDTVW